MNDWPQKWREANKAPPLSVRQAPCDTLNPPQNKVCQYNSLGSQLLTAEAFFTVTLSDPQRARYWKGAVIFTVLYLLVFPDMEITWLCPSLRVGYFERGGLLLHRFFSLLVSFQPEACQPNQYSTLREIDEADSGYRTTFYVCCIINQEIWFSNAPLFLKSLRA